MERRLRLLAVDDDLDVLRNLAIMLSLEGYYVMTASSGVEAASLIVEHLFDFVITDLRMPIVDGFEIVRRAQKQLPNARIIVTSRYIDEVTQAWIEKTGVLALKKPYNVHYLSQILSETRRV